MAHKLTIQISNKIATCLTEKPLVCGNSDYIAEFLFDEEWSAHTVKTARFRVNGEYIDVVFEGNTCGVPIISKAKLIWVGVFAGDLSTSTPAIVTCVPSILDNEDIPAPPREDVYSQIMEKCNEAVELVKDLEERAESGEFATGEIDYSKVNKYVDKVCEGKEDKTNKVDAISTVEEITDEKAYPSAKAVQEYGAALANDLISKLPRKLSDLEDDSQETPIQNALWAMQSDYTACDNDGNYIPHTYVKKTEVAEASAKKLDREWTKLAEETLTEGKVELIARSFLENFDNVSELIVSVYLPKIGTTDRYAIQLVMIDDENNIPTDFIGASGRLFVAQNTNNGYFTLQYNTWIVFNAYFYSDGSLIKTEMANSQFGSNCYPDRPWIATGVTGGNIRNKNGVALKLITGVAGSAAAFPVGTILKVYGR